MAIKLGELLIGAGLLTEAQLGSALAEQHKWGGRLGEILVRMNHVTEETLCRALSKQLGYQRADLDNLPPIPRDVLEKIPEYLASEVNALPLQLRDEGQTLVVAMAEPQSTNLIGDLRARTGCRIMPLIAGPMALARARARLYAAPAQEPRGGGDDHRTCAGPRGPEATGSPRSTTGVFSATSVRAGASVGQSPRELLTAVEAVQRKEVAALKAMVEMLIEKGVFTREEYVARVKRSG
jgi:hypothetical protein